VVYDKDDNLLQRFEYGLGQTPISFIQNGTKYYISSDQIGTPRVITDDNGTVVKAIDYDAFGNVISDSDDSFVISDSDDSFVIPFGFAGGLQDQDTKLFAITVLIQAVGLLRILLALLAEILIFTVMWPVIQLIGWT